MKILIPIDDSLPSRSAVEAVLSRPWPAGSKFRVLSVMEEFEQILPGPDPEHIRHARIERPEILASTVKLVEDAAAKLKEQFGANSVAIEILEGFAVERILEATRGWPADLIVMGSQGRSGLAHVLLGSVAEEVVVHAPCPVEVVRNPRSDKQATGENILIAMDDSVSAQTALSAVLERTWSVKTCFNLVTVVKIKHPIEFGYSAPGTLRTLQDREDLISSLKQRMEDNVAQLRKRFPQNGVTGEVIEGEIKETILELANEWPADLIILGSHNRTGLSLCLLGSVSQGVLSRSPFSVLIVRKSSVSQPAEKARSAVVATI